MIDMGIGLVMLIFGGYVIYEASTYPDFSKLTPVGSEVFPYIMGGVIVICSVIVIGRSAYKLFFSETKTEAMEKEKEQFFKIWTCFQENKKNLPAVIGIPFMMLLYALLLNSVGFEILSVLFLFISMLLCHERRVPYLVFVPVLGTVAMYYIFHVLLKIMLPMAFL